MISNRVHNAFPAFLYSNWNLLFPGSNIGVGKLCTCAAVTRLGSTNAQKQNDRMGKELESKYPNWIVVCTSEYTGGRPFYGEPRTLRLPPGNSNFEFKMATPLRVHRYITWLLRRIGSFSFHCSLEQPRPSRNSSDVCEWVREPGIGGK